MNKTGMIEKIVLWIPLLNFLEFFVYVITLLGSKKDIPRAVFYKISLISLILIFGVGFLEMKLFNIFFDYSAIHEYFIQYYVQGLTIAIICFFSKGKVLEYKSKDI